MKGVEDRQIYLEHALHLAPRLLSLLDRNPMSPTFGCFHRAYWHYKTSSFPSSIYQCNLYSLALLYNSESSINPYHKDPVILKYIKAGLEFTSNIQKRDGSFDEWFANERGWSGPTGYICHILCSTYPLIKEDLEHNELKRLEKMILKSCQHLSKRWESHILVNHILMVLLPLQQAYHLFKREEDFKAYQKIKSKLFKYLNGEEGWGLEYDGLDIGYLTGSLSFLGRLYELDPDEKYKSFAEKSFEFLGYFIFSDQHMAPQFGSRQTSCFFWYATEYWAQKINLPVKLVSFTRNLLKTQNHFQTNSLDDHYLTYRSWELLDCYRLKGSLKSSETKLPFQESGQTRWFKHSGILYFHDKNRILVCFAKKGGSYLIYDKTKKQFSDINFGFQISSKRKFYSSNCVNKKTKIKFKDNELIVKSFLSQMKYPQMTPFKQVVFQLIMQVFGRNAFLSEFLKNRIRNLLMVGFKRSRFSLERKITLGERIKVSDHLSGKGKINQIYYGGIYSPRYVPQSRYFETVDLQFFPEEIREFSGHSRLDLKLSEVY